MLRIRSGGLLAAMLLTLAILTCCNAARSQTSAPSQPAASRPAASEKLIMGFEKSELEGKKEGRSCWITMQDAGGGVDFSAPFERGEGNLAWTWECRPGEATEGRLALVAQLLPGEASEGFRSTPLMERHYPIVRNHGQAAVILNTFQWLAHCNSDVSNWSGYALLRVDVRAQAAAKIWLAVEDDLIEPPVVCAYDVPGGKWITLEMDLSKAVRERQLDLTKITNFWLLGHSQQAAEVRLDNIRAVLASVPAKLEVLRDDRPMALPPTKLPDVPQTPKLADAKPDRSPVALTAPVEVPRANLAPFGWIAAYDNKRILLGTCLNDRPSVRFSQDGGATWQAVDRPAVVNLDHGTARGSVVDQNGDVITVSGGPGCAGIGITGPRQFLSKYTFNGTAWDLRQPADILDCDIRHCSSSVFTVRLSQGKHAGRLWAVWGEIDRFRTLCVHAKFSDDDGVTWNLPGKGGLVPGSRESEFSYNTYGYQQPRCAPYGDGIAIFWQDSRGLMWNRFDDGKWLGEEVIDATAAPKLAPSDNESFRVPGSCITRGRDEVFLTAWKIPGVLRWDGKKWQRELADASDAGVLTICGGKSVMLFTAGSTEQPPGTKRIQVMKNVPVLCYRRKADGSWEKPLDLSGGPTTILEYRQITSLVASPYSPPNFAPVAWSDRNTVKFVKVPALEE